MKMTKREVIKSIGYALATFMTIWAGGWIFVYIIAFIAKTFMGY